MPGNDFSPHSRPSRNGPRSLLALFVLLLATVFASFMTQQAAQAAAASPSAVQPAAACVVPYNSSAGAWEVPWGCSSGEVAGAHVCAYVGPSTGASTAVECTDIYVTNNSSATEMWGEGEFYCQGSHPQCLGMNVNVGLSQTNEDNGSIVTGPAQNYKCNPGVGACPTSGRAMVSTGHDAIHSNTCYEAYTWDPAGNVISVNGASAAYHSASELDSPKTLQICLIQGT
jgi:hypothetical protein